MDKNQIVLANKKRMREIAKQIAISMQTGKCLFLYGDLGSGKTTFAGMLIKELMLLNNFKISYINQIYITSPTFNILNQYDLNNQEKIWHFDLYRIKDPNELIELGIGEASSSGMSIVEWPEIIENSGYWSKDNIIRIKLKSHDDRNVMISIL